jgi:hypothetical protein
MNPLVSDPTFWSRVQFCFMLTYHYLFPQLTMGLAWFIVYWKCRASGRTALFGGELPRVALRPECHQRYPLWH